MYPSFTASFPHPTVSVGHQLTYSRSFGLFQTSQRLCFDLLSASRPGPTSRRPPQRRGILDHLLLLKKLVPSSQHGTHLCSMKNRMWMCVQSTDPWANWESLLGSVTDNPGALWWIPEQEGEGNPGIHWQQAFEDFPMARRLKEIHY